MLQLGEEEIIFLDLDQSADHVQNLLDCSLSEDLSCQTFYDRHPHLFEYQLTDRQTNQQNDNISY